MFHSLFLGFGSILDRSFQSIRSSYKACMILRNCLVVASTLKLFCFLLLNFSLSSFVILVKISFDVSNFFLGQK